MRALKQFAASLALASLLLLGHAPLASADVNNFTINEFDADYTLSNKNPHGQLAVQESIDLTFTDYNHGILRAIPKSYKKHPLNIHSVNVTSTSGAPVDLMISDSNGNEVLKIGNPSQTITGHQQYTISYTVDNVIGFYPDHDELYWDVNGDQWAQSFAHVTAKLHLAPGIQLSSAQPLCYTGIYGSTVQDCAITAKDNLVTAETTQPLSPGQNLSIVTGFAKGYFAPFTWVDWVRQYAPLILSLLALPLIAFVVCYSLWRRNGRDSKGTGIIVAQYDAPKGLTPLEVGTIVDFKTDDKDLTATLIDLAIRKHIKIIETRTNKLIGRDAIDYSLELLSKDVTTLSPTEIQILSSLFPLMEVGQQANLKTQAHKLASTAKRARENVADQLTTAGYFKQSPLKAPKIMIGVATVGLFGIWFLASMVSPLILVGVGITIAIIFGFARIMPARTQLGVDTLEHIKGLKLFLQVTEAERFKKLQGPNAAYASSAEPVKTVDLFEKLLPYAIVLGVEKEWAGQFANLYTQPPSWYAGNTNAFSAIYLADTLNSGFNSAVNNAFTAPNNSSSSGFGGGFSGGGGGGGGGGGW